MNGNDEKEFEADSSDRFPVHIHNLAGQSITLECTSNTPVSYLMDQFRQILPMGIKQHFILLFKDDGSMIKQNGTIFLIPLDAASTLKKEGITHEISLFAIHTRISDPESESFIEPLHDMIEDMARLNPDEFTSDMWNLNTNITELLTEYNNLTVGTKYVFNLSMDQRHHFPTKQIVESPKTIRYISGLSIPNRLQNEVLYFPFGLRHAERRLVSAHLSIEGTLDSIEMYLSHFCDRPLKCKRFYTIHVLLKGPIVIRDQRTGQIKYESNHPDAIVKIPYDYIEFRSPLLRNTSNAHSHGGRRLTKRTMRTQKKRKIRQRTYKKRS
jgi:hypothetical protein